MMTRCSLFFVLSFSCLLSAHAQTAAIQLPPGVKLPPGVLPEGVVVTPGGQPGMPGQPGAPAAGAEQNVRLEKFKKLKFDRRPSVILKAWSTPLVREEEDEPAKTPVAVPPKPAPPATPPKKEEPKAATKDGKPKEKTPEQIAQEKQAQLAKEQAEKAKLEAEKKAKEAKEIDWELKVFSRHVTLGNWDAIKAYLAEKFEKEEDGKQAYKHMLTSLQSTPGGSQGVSSSQGRRYLEKNEFSTDDVFALAAAAPHGLEKAELSSLGSILNVALSKGNMVKHLIERLKQEAAKNEADKPTFNKRQAAQLLFAAGKPAKTGDFLPKADEAIKEKDREALNMLSRYFLALHAEEKKVVHLEQAWDVTQAVLAMSVKPQVTEEAKPEAKKEPPKKEPKTEPPKDDKAKDEAAAKAKAEAEKKKKLKEEKEKIKQEREEALRRAVELAPKIRKELGETWLEESFTSQPERGMEVIAAIGGAAATGLQRYPTNPSFRLKSLELQSTATEALLKASAERAGKWKDTLNLLATNWLREAVVTYQLDTSTRRGPMLQRDPFGNYFYMSSSMGMSVNNMGYNPYQGSRNQARPIGTGDILEIKPSGKWLETVVDSLRPKFSMIFAQLFLKVAEEDKAFPYIEQLATTHPEPAKDLVEEFLRVWTQNHDPNSSRNRTNPYMYMYGFERKAEGIPLTRSKQERNLKELAELVERLKKLPLGDLNEELLARAFTTCHSSAEVYRLNAIETVFGSLDSMKPKTLAEMAQQMRANLMGVWKAPAMQKQKKTNRKKKDIQAEVLRGYQVAKAVIDGGLTKHTDNWSLVLAKAALMHDEINYQQEISKSSSFSEKRQAAFDQFKHAAELYAAKVADLPEEEQSTKAFEIWYYASLGACDLNQIKEDKVPDLRQPKIIKEAILALPGEAAEKHLEMFANSLFTRMSAVNPAVKFRYVKNGLDIVGDHKRAIEARKVYDYYKDLVTEIKLEAKIDGNDVVGHERPFGVFINLRHTREIERESGGFGRYLQNQNSGRMYYYNYGRPTENYRDKFEEAVKQAVGEHFEVLSVTFQSEDVNSKAIEGEYGWRVTPYAYVLLKPRGPEVDKIPPFKIDLDFLDTSGYAIIPLESPAVPIDASAKTGEPRPIQKLEVTQTLDERQADEGKLILEVKATGQGLVPELGDVLDIAPKGFDVVDTEDQGLSVSRFDPESDETVVVSERTWMITMEAEAGLPERPKNFSFGAPKIDDSKSIYQRYVDADLSSVEQVISLEQQYGKPSYGWVWGLIAVAGAIVVLTALVMLSSGKPDEGRQIGFQMPDTVTPFTVLGLLRNIQRNNGLNDKCKQELATSINRIEQYYFIGDGEEPNLHEVAEGWVRRT